MQYTQEFQQFINESKESEQLASKIDQAIVSIDDSMSYIDLAHAVAKVIRDEYGSHLYVPFIQELKKQLK